MVSGSILRLALDVFLALFRVFARCIYIVPSVPELTVSITAPQLRVLLGIESGFPKTKRTAWVCGPFGVWDTL